MTRIHRIHHRLPALLLQAVLLSTLTVPAAASRADRSKPMEVLADKSGTADLKNQVSRFSGNVVITQGTMTIRADRVEIRQTADGFYSGTAWGVPGAPVSYRQKRDDLDEYVEGAAERVEFDGKTEVLRFIGSGSVRRLRGREVVDEITGSLITWNHAAEQFSVQGGNPAGTSPGSPGGRARAVFTPPAGSAAASQAGTRPGRTGTEPSR